MPTDLSVVRDWAPFTIDALGLVTLLGAESVDRVAGQLTHDKLTAWLPTLGTYVFADNRVIEPLAGFHLYNITDGIMATDLAGWFARWLLREDVTVCASTLRISWASTDPRPAPSKFRHLAETLLTYSLGVVGTLVPAVLAAVLRDWWGLANGIAIIASVLVRQACLRQHRAYIDRVETTTDISPEDVKLFVTLPDGRAVTVFTTRDILIECLLTTPRPARPRLYMATRAVGWGAFGLHVICLGMASLFSQLLCITLLLSVTVLMVWQIGQDRQRVGGLMLQRQDADLPFRAAAYARLDLTGDQEESMVLWNLFPHKKNAAWWSKYEKAKMSENGFKTWNTVLKEADVEKQV